MRRQQSGAFPAWWLQGVAQADNVVVPKSQRHKKPLRTARFVSQPTDLFDMRKVSKSAQPPFGLDVHQESVKSFTPEPQLRRDLNGSVPHGFDICPRGHLRGISMRNNKIVVIESESVAQGQAL